MGKIITLTISDELFAALPEVVMPRKGDEQNLSDEDLFIKRLTSQWQNRLIGKAGSDAMNAELQAGRAAAQTAIQDKRAELEARPAVTASVESVLEVIEVGGK